MNFLKILYSYLHFQENGIYYMIVSNRRHSVDGFLAAPFYGLTPPER